MAVYKRKRDGTWCFEFPLPGSSRSDRQRKCGSGFATKKAALEAEAQARLECAKVQTVQNAAEEPPTLDVLFEKFLALHCQGADPLSPTTVQHYREHRGYLSPELLAMPPQAITLPHLSAEWKRLRERGGRTRRSQTPRPLGARTVRHIAATLSSVFTWACRQGFLTANPVRYSEKPRAVKKDVQMIERTTASRMLAADYGFWCQPAFLETTLALGARRGEVLALRWPDWRNGYFCIERNLIQFKDPETGQRRWAFKSTKEGKKKNIPVPATLAPILETHRRRQNELKRQLGDRYQDHDLIFCHEDGTPLWPNTVSASVSRLMRIHLGLAKGQSLHSLRHTHASEGQSRGVPLATVSKRLGHSSIRTTADIYSHALTEDDYKAAEAYDDYRRSLEEDDHGTVQ